MSKKYIICWVSRAGKSTLAKAISTKVGCSCIPTDPFVTAFESVFPQLWITHKVSTMQEYFAVCDIFTPFLIEFIENGIDYELDSYVVEWFHINIEQLWNKLGKTHQIVVLGYPSISWDDKFAATRMYDGQRESWTNDISDDDMHQIIDWYITISQELKKTADRLGIPFIDTSVNHDGELQKYIDMIS